MAELSHAEWVSIRQSAMNMNLGAVEEPPEAEPLPLEQTLEEAVYGEQRPVAVATSVEEFHDLAADFNEADALSAIIGGEAWGVLKHRAEREYRSAAQAERDYIGLDAAKIASLRFERIKAKVVVDWLNQQEFFADDTPKPRLPR